MTTAAGASSRRDAEHRFFVLFSWAMLATVLAGFGRSFFLRPWFPEMRTQTPTESYFYFHGAVFTAWFLLVALQPALIATRKTALHRKLGWAGAALAAAMLPVGIHAALTAARRPTGFFPGSGPAAAHRFLIVPLTDMVMFALFVTLAVLRRDDAQSHKRFMLFASGNLLSAAVARLPLSFIEKGGPLAVFGPVDLLLLVVVVWDLATRRRIHPATLVGLIGTVASQALRLALSRTEIWANIANRLLG